MKPKTVRFWLDNKQLYGVVTGENDGDLLVSYQKRFYIIRGDVPLMKNRRPMRFTATTLPAIWKKALHGTPVSSTQTGQSSPAVQDDLSPKRLGPIRRKAREETKALETLGKVQKIERAIMENVDETPKEEIQVEEKRISKRVKKGETGKSTKGEPVIFECPYCNHKAEAPSGRKDGRPFFHTCEKCNGEFGLRIVPVTAYQAEVAAFPRKGFRP
jgi:transcription elongation factor Elf1